jgi:hypothetical protein
MPFLILFVVGIVFLFFLLSGKAGESAALARAGLRFEKAMLGDGHCF